MTETDNHVPGPNEPDPDNVRFRSFQGGADSLGDVAHPERGEQYADIKRRQGGGPFDNGPHLANTVGGISAPSADLQGTGGTVRPDMTGSAIRPEEQ